MDQFKNITVGSLFIYKGRIYRRTNNLKGKGKLVYNAINMISRHSAHFASNANVKPIKETEIVK